jgi:hypothetical protein
MPPGQDNLQFTTFISACWPSVLQRGGASRQSRVCTCLSFILLR